VLKIANAFEIYKCVLDGDHDGIMFHPAEEMAAEHNSLMQSLLSGNSHFAPHYLLIANNYSGDMIGLDTSAIDEGGDCPVVLISHGAYGVSYEWSSIAEFLMNILVEPSSEDDEE